MTRALAQLATLVLSLAAVHCAASRSEESGDKAAPPGEGRPSIPPDAGKSPPVAGSGAAAASGDTTGCRSEGIYGYGKGSPRLPCCSPLHEFYLRQAGYDDHESRVCVEPIEGSYGCINGKCGDGRCERGENAACGCEADCPDAVWEGTTSKTAVGPATSNGFSEVPASCTKPDLLARLQTSPDAIDCGDLKYDAYLDELVAAFKCVHDAYQSDRPFQLLWQTAGTDSINPNGLVGRLRNGVLEVFTLQVYTGDEFGLGLQGSTALWRRCPLVISGCEAGDLDDCLSCTASPDLVTCECLPKGTRPNAPDGKKVELRCQRDAG